jgi:hypothetical protein
LDSDNIMATVSLDATWEKKLELKIPAASSGAASDSTAFWMELLATQKIRDDDRNRSMGRDPKQKFQCFV